MLPVFPKTQKLFLKLLSETGCGEPLPRLSDQGFVRTALVSDEGLARPAASAYLGKTLDNECDVLVY